MTCPCSSQCPRCIINGEWDCQYITQEACEQCVTTTFCTDLETNTTTEVADCSECVAENEYCYTVTEGPCGTWEEDHNCCPCKCSSAEDCWGYGLTCAEIYPEYPRACCNGKCLPEACYPGAVITLHFSKKPGCVDPNGVLDHLADNEEFDVVIAGGSLTCPRSGTFSSAPCDTEWTLSVGCEVSDLTINLTISEFCDTCYEFLGWDAERGTC